MATFASIFQTKINYGSDNIELVSLDDLKAPLEASYLAQEPVKEANVSKIVKGVIADRQLWQIIEVALVQSEGIPVLLNGRHRYLALREICGHYGINAAGKIVKMEGGTTENPDIETIDDEIKVRVIELPDRAALVKYLQSCNESRTMPPAEKAVGKEYGGMLKPLEVLKLRLAKALHALFNSNGVSVTLNTCRDISTKLASATGTKFKYISDSDIQTLASDFAGFALENWESYDSNFSRTGYKEAVESFAMTEAPETVLDKDGDEVEDATYFLWFAGQIKQPEKQKKASKTQELANQLAALQAQLAALGVTPAA